MDDRIISTTEDQATGAFVDILNDIRYEELLRKYKAVDVRKNGADGIISVAVSAMSSELGKKLIPIPVVGPIIGNTVGMFIHKVVRNQVVKRNVSSKPTAENAA
ncbi:hypothetical protein [Ruminococcus sp.]|uniref:hypothetical protein n=1 Tax=Ruminococcus sp. TaxID=41978 RepID=UPI002586EA74|nr:hypothetical protein [Ruminococcus sp.]MCR5020308.1 hypothetical protein [Ruminococcus sp.]